MAAPCALIASCTSNFDPQEIVKHILNVSSLPEGCPVVESVMSYDWHIDTKYYTADVHLCTTSERTIGDETFAESVEAFIVYFDSQQECSFQKVSSWMPYLAHINPAVQILVCQTSRQDDVVSRQTALEWCIDNGFELVELEPEESSEEEEEEDDFAETIGPKRIVQALHAHTWPNLTLKNKSPACSPYIRSLMQEEAALRSTGGAEPESNKDSKPSTTVDTEQCAQQTSQSSPSSPSPSAAAAAEEGSLKSGAEGETHTSSSSAAAGSVGNKALSSQKPIEGFVPDDNELAMLTALGNEDTGEESFEQLFTRLRVMKDKASTLPAEERKAYAEQIAVTFWRAIGGDEDEIEGLFDDLEPAQT